MIIAIVDDEETILDAIRLLLEDDGWHVRTYSTGDDFLKEFDRCTPDCLILDPHLPGTNGAEVARSVANSDKDIPIIGLTARPDARLSIELKKAGAQVMLTKPVTFEVLIEHIRLVLAPIENPQ